jgi:hypothetical protein
MHKDWIIEKSTIYKAIEDDDDDLPLIKSPNTVMINESPSNQDEQKSEVNIKVYNQLRMLDICINSQARNDVKDYKEGREITLEQANVTIISAKVIKEPMNFDESWDRSDEFQQRNGNKNQQRIEWNKNEGVWEVIDFNDILNDRSLHQVPMDT